MKILLCLLAFAAIVDPLRAIPVVAVSGTIFTEKEFEPGRFRIKSAPITVRAIYEAFGVSRTDYFLDCDPVGTNFLTLRPRAGVGTNLPVIVILQNPGLSTRYLRDWAGGPPRHEMALTSPAGPVPLFNAFRGTALGRVGGRPTPSGGGTLRVRYEVTGSSTTHILKFRFTAFRSNRPPSG